MTLDNWELKFSAEMYRSLFRFEKNDIDDLVRYLDMPSILYLDSRHKTNRLIHVFVSNITREILAMKLSMCFSRGWHIHVDG